MSGPTASPTPETVAQMPTAPDRSCGSVKACVTSASALGITIAPPTPAIACPAMTTDGEFARKVSRLPAPRTAAPIANTRRRPNRSPKVPAESTRLATAIEYTLAIQTRSDGVVCRWRWIGPRTDTV